MKHFIYKSIVIVLALSICCSCKPKNTAPSPGKGSINPTHYVSIGGSLTSGFADGALYYNAQMTSFPNLIAGQLELVGAGNFNQPLMPQGSVGCGTADSSGHTIFVAPFKLGYSTDCLGVNSLGPIPAAEAGDLSSLSTNVYASQGPFNNIGVSGAKAIEIIAAGYGNIANGPGKYNPFFTRMASNPVTASMLSDAMMANPTFFSSFAGLDDILTYASNGAASDSITSLTTFNASINTILSTLMANGAKGVIANIPDVTRFPFFTTVPWNGLTLTRQSQADSLNAAWVGLPYNFHVGNNAFIIADPSVPVVHSRQIREGELILLSVPLNNIKCHDLGTLIPIPSQYVLTAIELTTIRNAISTLNASLQSIAQAKGLALVDAASFFSQLNTGISYDGISMNAQFVTGGAFSLDGVNLSPIGNALLANEYIKAINTTYGATIPLVDVTKYHGILFP